jgi:hypothetical protein
VLDPAGLRKTLPEFPLRAADNPAADVKNNAARTRRALIKGE